jgi:hypothetical protein
MTTGAGRTPSTEPHQVHVFYLQFEHLVTMCWRPKDRNASSGEGSAYAMEADLHNKWISNGSKGQGLCSNAGMGLLWGY